LRTYLNVKIKQCVALRSEAIENYKTTKLQNYETIKLLTI